MTHQRNIGAMDVAAIRAGKATITWDTGNA